MEKRKPTHNLAAFKAAARSGDGIAISGAAFSSAAGLGFSIADICDVVQTMQRSHFYKSMTSHRNHREWQDVYHVPSLAGLLYVKFTATALTEFLLLSFKEKDNG